MQDDHPYYEAIFKDTRYKDGPTPKEFPRSESMKQTIERTVPYWNGVIVPQILKGKRVLIVGHGSNLKGLVMYLDGW
jgi:2,3-bisphosphoglycerate-dependent phosphoglycerate mutase